MIEMENTRPAQLRQLCDGRKIGQQRDVPVRDAVSCDRQFLQAERLQAKGLRKMRREIVFSMSSHFHSRELPHARKEDSIVGARIANKQHAPFGIAQNGGGDANLHWSAFAARCGNTVSEAKRVSAAKFGNGAVNAKRIRSEERRVGKEGRSRLSAEHNKRQ